MIKRNFILTLTMFSMLTGCSDSFNPNGPFDDRLVVYSILSTRDPYALVKVFNTYTIEGFDPFVLTDDPVMPGAFVELQTDGELISLKDTTIFRIDKSRYSSDIPAYVGYPFILKRGTTYTLTVDANGKHATSSVRIPGTVSMELINRYIVDDPDRYVRSSFQLELKASSAPFASMMRSYLQYTVETENGLERRVREIPTAVVENDPVLGSVPLYPELRKTAAGQGRNAPAYSVEYYLAERGRIYSENPGRQVRFEKLIFIFTQAEENIYSYYNVVNEFRDKKSIRLDEPDFSNINGGVGLFGAFMEDSLIIPIMSPPW